MRRAQEVAEAHARKAAEHDRHDAEARERIAASKRACEAKPLHQRLMEAKAELAANLTRQGMDRGAAEQHARAAVERAARR